MSDSSGGGASDSDGSAHQNADAATAGPSRRIHGRDPLFLGIASICDTAVRLTGSDGAALAVLTTSRGIRELVHATDAAAQQLDELQFVLGEGPCLDAYRKAQPQLCAYIADDVVGERWPAFASELVALGVEAVFAFPVPGRQRPLGVLELYRRTSGPLSETEQQSAQVCATALQTTLENNWREHLQRSSTEDAALEAIAVRAAADSGPEAFTRSQVHIAAGMVAVQLEVPTSDALDRVRAYAYAQNRSVIAVAAVSWRAGCRSPTSTARGAAGTHDVVDMREKKGSEMIAARDRLAIASLTTALTSEFDLPTVLDTAAHDARAGFDAVSAAVILLDDHLRAGDTGVEVVAEAVSDPTEIDLGFLTDGPALDSARGGAVTMVPDLADAADTRWPDYRRDAVRAGLRGVRSFPVIVLGTSVGALVVHTADPWGSQRSNELGVILANLIAIAISVGADNGRRRSDTSETIQTLLQGTVAISTATGIITEHLGMDPARARLQLHRLARAHQTTVTTHAHRIIAAHDDGPDAIPSSGLLAAPTVPPDPPRIDR